jgi:tetratricopeptide (TPR) repeat protein
MSVRARIFGLLALAALLAGAGCGADSLSLPAEKDEPLYREAQQLARQDRTDQALVSYLKVISKRGDDQAPESHLDVGIIYLDNQKNPIYAIYHFEKYLELEPNSPLAHHVRDEIDRAKRDFARTLPAQPLESQAGQMDANDELDRLRNENNALRAEISTLRSGLTTGPGRGAASADYPSPDLPAAPAAAAVPIAPVSGADEGAPPPISRISAAPPAETAAAAPAPAGGRVHVVVKGDSIYNLAARYYGTGSLAHERLIVQANRGLLESEKSTLKLGMQLRIP